MQLSKQDIQIFKIASNDKHRPVLCTVEVKAIQDDDNWKIRLAATDSYKLTEKTISVLDKPTFDYLLIHAQDLKSLNSLMGKNDTAKITPSEFQVYDKLGVNFKTAMTYQPLDEGNFPEYEKLIPDAEPTASVKVSAEYMKQVMEQANGGTVTLEIHGKLNPITVKQLDDERNKHQSIVMPVRER